MLYKGLVGAAFMALCCGCSDGGHAGNSTETENAVAFRILENDLPASGVLYKVRPQWYLADSSGRETFGVTSEPLYTGISDEEGWVRLVDHGVGDFSIVFRRADSAVVRQYSVGENSQGVADSSVTLEPAGTLEGYVELPDSSDGVWVFFYGLDVAVKTDSTGRFKVTNLPAGDLSMLVVDPREDEPMGKVPVTVTPGDTLRLDSLKQMLNSVLIYDFETAAPYNSLLDGRTFGWYLSKTDSATLDEEQEEDPLLGFVDAGGNREGQAYCMKYSLTLYPQYVLMGTRIASAPSDLSQLDSLELWLRGDGFYHVVLESLDDSVNYKALYIGMGTAEWNRVAITPEMFVEDTAFSYHGWEATRTHITHLSIFAFNGTELCVDDVRLYGVKQKDLAP